MIYLLQFILITASVSLAGESEWTTNGPIGGCVRSLAISPYDPSVIFLGTADGGFYKSVDGGGTWNFSGMDLLYGYEEGRYITSNIVPLNASAILAASWYKLYKSGDMGENWQILLNLDAGIISSIAVHPFNDNIILVGSIGGFGGMLSSAHIHKTTNGGINWYAAGNGFTNIDVTDIKFAPINPDIIFAATYSGVYMSMDGGESSWQDISGNLPSFPISAIALDSTDLQKIYVGTRTGVYSTIDWGTSWQNVTGNNFANRFINLHALTVLGKDGLAVFAGTDKGLYRSDNGCLTWEEKNNGLTNIAVNSILPVSDREVFLGTEDGFYISSDFGNTWTKKVNGLMAFNNTAIAFSTQHNPSKVVIGTGGSGIHYSDDWGENWNAAAMESGFKYINELISAPSNSQIMYAAYIGETDSTETRFGILKSVNGGNDWHSLDGELAGKEVISIAIDFNDPETIFVGTLANKIYKSTDGGLSWQNKDIEPGKRCVIWSLAVDPLNSNAIYAGIEFNKSADPHGIYKSVNAGESWQHCYQGLPPQETYFQIKDICLNPVNPQTIYLAVNSSGIYKSTNGGTSWKQINSGIGTNENRIINSITIDPQDTSRIYAAGVKIYTSEDAGKTWQEMMEGLPEYYGAINKIRIDPNDHSYIYAATDGYGVLTFHRQTSYVNDGSDKSVPMDYALYQNYPNPFNPGTNIRFEIPRVASVTITVYNVRGEAVRTITKEQKPAGSYVTYWDGRDDAGNSVSTGIYICKMTAGNFSAVRKMILAK